MTYRASTFSIVACDPDRGESGVAVQSRFLAVGSLVPGARSGVGAAASQAQTRSGLVVEALDLLEAGRAPEEAVAELLRADSSAQVRQIGVVDSRGRSFGYTGSACIEWSGHRAGPNYCCQGNVLLGPSVLDGMARAFETSPGDLAERLLAALEAAQRAGGERRGRQSAALIVERALPGMIGESTRSVDLRVDHSLWPIDDLRKLLQLHRVEFAPNHRDRIYPLTGETREKLLEILQKRGLISLLGEGETLEAAIGDLHRAFDLPRPGDGFVSGALVDRIVTDWYGAEYDRLKIGPKG